MVLLLHPLFSILVLNHNWSPDEHYPLWEAWVAQIVEIRGNSPRNVRLSRSFAVLALTSHRSKTWLIVRWYFSGNDIANHQTAKVGV